MDERVLQFYDEALDKFGPNDPQGAGWGLPGGQEERFRILSEAADLTGTSVLDVGCGLGDLYGYLEKNNIPILYTGIDINPRSIALAREKYPRVQFEAADFEEYAGEGADYVLSSGALTFKIENHHDIYLGFIRKMFHLSRRGCAFNMLKRGEHTDDATYATYDPMEIYTFCTNLTPKLVLRQDYLAHDFTMYLYR
jgi:SAM-dependent methyltransferase